MLHSPMEHLRGDADACAMKVVCRAEGTGGRQARAGEGTLAARPTAEQQGGEVQSKAVGGG